MRLNDARTSKHLSLLHLHTPTVSDHKYPSHAGTVFSVPSALDIAAPSRARNYGC